MHILSGSYKLYVREDVRLESDYILYRVWICQIVPNDCGFGELRFYCKVISDCSAHTIKVFSPEEA